MITNPLPLPTQMTLEELAWALATVLDGVKLHDLPNQLGESEDCERVWAAFLSAQEILARPRPDPEVAAVLTPEPRWRLYGDEPATESVDTVKEAAKWAAHFRAEVHEHSEGNWVRLPIDQLLDVAELLEKVVVRYFHPAVTPAQTAQPENLKSGLDVVRQAIEERDDFERRYYDLASNMVYEGNSVAHWRNKAVAYKDVIGKVWDELQAAGIACDGTRSCVEAVRDLAASLAQPKEVVRPIWTEGICGDGAAILKDGVMQPIEDVIAALNAAELARPEAGEPTDSQILDAINEATAEFHPYHPEALPLNSFEYAVELELRKARTILRRLSRPAPQPTQASERLPEPKDCDEKGRCWWSVSEYTSVTYDCNPVDREEITYPPSYILTEFHPSYKPNRTWLPYSALPLPPARKES